MVVSTVCNLIVPGYFERLIDDGITAKDLGVVGTVVVSLAEVATAPARKASSSRAITMR